MKSLALLLLPGFFLLFFPVTPLCAQDVGSVGLELSVARNQQDAIQILADNVQKIQRYLNQQEAYKRAGIRSDEQRAIENLEKRCKDLEDALKDAQRNIQSLQADARIFYDKTDDSGKTTTDMETRLYQVDHRLTIAEDAIQDLNSRILPHPASKPKAPVNKPKPAVDEGTH